MSDDIFAIPSGPLYPTGERIYRDDEGYWWVIRPRAAGVIRKTPSSDHPWMPGSGTPRSLERLR